MISTTQMTWNRAARTFTTEASDHGRHLPWLRAYPDSCDAGLDVRSHWTGRVVRFVVVETLLRDREVTGWRLRPTDRNLNITLTIFND